MENVVLLGIKHCGKSTQGRLLAERLGAGFLDTDDIVEEISGLPPRRLYTERGREAFMRAEAEACAEVAGMTGRFVAATGGGFCTNADAVAALRGSGLFVFLAADERTACDRIVKEIAVAEDGSLLNLPAYIARENPSSIDGVRASFGRFFAERTRLCRQICDVEVQMLPAPKLENLARILECLRARGILPS